MRAVAWDIETTDLKALMGRVLCCSFLPLSGPPGFDPTLFTVRADQRPWRGRSKIDDSKVVAAIRDELAKYDVVVGWNSKLFDAPFVNARLVKHSLPRLRLHWHLDAMWYSGGSTMRVGSKKLINVQKFLDLGEEKTPISWETWQLAGAGDRAAMDEVVVHCEQDVKVLGEAYWKLLPSVARLERGVL